MTSTRKIISFVLLFGVLFLSFVACDDETIESFNSAEGVWKFGQAGTIEYADKTIPLTEKYLNYIIAHYSGIDTSSSGDLTLEFKSGGSITSNGNVLQNSSWSQTGSDVSFNIGSELNFSGTVYVSYMTASATNIQTNLLPETVMTLLSLAVDDDKINTYSTIDKIGVYLSKQ